MLLLIPVICTTQSPGEAGMLSAWLSASQLKGAGLVGSHFYPSELLTQGRDGGITAPMAGAQGDPDGKEAGMWLPAT